MHYANKIFRDLILYFANSIARDRNHECEKDRIRSDNVART